MSPRRRVSAAAAALGACCLIIAPLTSPAGAASPGIPIYDSHASSQGVVLTFAVKPSIFDPLLQGGSHYAETGFSSQGGGSATAFAAPVFPGKFASGALTGAVGCGGLKGWVEAKYPATPGCKTSSEDSFVKTEHSRFFEAFGHPEGDDALNAILDRTDVGIGTMAVNTALGYADAGVTTGGFDLMQDPGGAPVLEIGSMIIHTGGDRSQTAIEHTATVVAQDVRLLGGVVTIGTITSTARTMSNGEASTADAAMTFADVSVEVGGGRHRATIDDRGIRIDDPTLSRDQRLGLQESLDDALLEAGIDVSATTSTEITEGPQAEASVGGLNLAFHGTLPSVPIPSEAAPYIGLVISQIPTKCVFEITHHDRPDQLAPVTDGLPQVPLCFGAGVIPLGGSEPYLQMTIASASSFSVAGLSLPSVGPATPPIQPPTGGGGPIGGVTIPPASYPPPPSAVDDGGSPPIAGVPQATVPVGLIARLPAVALAWAGIALLVLAVGASLGPSLRHARSH